MYNLCIAYVIDELLFQTKILSYVFKKVQCTPVQENPLQFE